MSHPPDTLGAFRELWNEHRAPHPTRWGRSSCPRAVNMPDLSSIDEALFHLALANLPADLRQQRIDALLDERLRLTADA